MAKSAEQPAVQPMAVASGISFGRATPARILYLARPIAGSSLSTFLAGIGIAELPAPGRSVQAKAKSVLGIGPLRWWFVEEDAVTANGPTVSIAAAFTIAVDIGDAWERFRLSGESVFELLAKGSSLDLDRRVFAEGACTLAAFAQLHTLLHRVDGDRHFDLYCGRSYALSLEEWLTEASAEFGAGMSIEKGGAAGKAEIR